MAAFIRNRQFLGFVAFLVVLRIAMYFAETYWRDRLSVSALGDQELQVFEKGERRKLFSGEAEAYVLYYFDNDSDCQRCVNHVNPWLELSAGFPNVEWVVVLANGVSVPAAKRRIRDAKVPGTVFVDLDGAVGERLNLASYYKLVLFDRDGKIVSIMDELPVIERDRKKVLALALQRTLGFH